MTRVFTTNLRCQACFAVVRPILDAEPAVGHWSIDLAHPQKILSLDGPIGRDRLDELFRRAGYQITGDMQPAPAGPKPSYFPLALIVAYIAGTVALIEFTHSPFDHIRAMTNVMAGFFLVFSFFKLLDVKSFADSFAMYDVLAGRSRAYAIAYPFIELSLGIAYVTRFWPVATNAVTLVIMTLGTVGVARSLLAKRVIRCACLGTVFNLPMTYVTLIEDFTMAVMAAVMLM